MPNFSALRPLLLTQSALVGVHRHCDNDLITDDRNVFGQAKVRPFQVSRYIAGTQFSLVQRADPALEPGDLDGQGLGHAKHGELSLCRNHLFALKNELVGFEVHGRELLHVEQTFVSQMAGPRSGTHINGVGLHREINAAGSVDFTVQTNSIDMGSTAWTSHLADEGLFNVKKFPTMHFKSDKLVFEGEKVVAAEGQFTMLGVTKTLTVKVTGFQCGVSPLDKRKLCSGNISANLKRSDFGLTKYIPVVSDEVVITVPVDAYKS